MNSVFCVILLVPRSRNILHHSPPSKTRWRPVLFTLRKNFIQINEVAVPYNTNKETKFGYKVFKNMYFFYFLTINALKMSSKCFVNKWWVGDKPTEFGKTVLNIWKTNMWKQLCEVYAKTILRGSVNIRHNSPPLRWIIVNYSKKCENVINAKDVQSEKYWTTKRIIFKIIEIKIAYYW